MSELYKEALKKIAAIENQYDGGDWDEIEEARAIAKKALGEDAVISYAIRHNPTGRILGVEFAANMESGETGIEYEFTVDHFEEIPWVTKEKLYAEIVIEGQGRGTLELPFIANGSNKDDLEVTTISL